MDNDGINSKNWTFNVDIIATVRHTELAVRHITQWVLLSSVSRCPRCVEARRRRPNVPDRKWTPMTSRRRCPPPTHSYTRPGVSWRHRLNTWRRRHMVTSQVNRQCMRTCRGAWRCIRNDDNSGPGRSLAPWERWLLRTLKGAMML